MPLNETLLDISLKNLREMSERYQRIDSKVLAVITVCGVLISLIAGLNKNGVVNGNLTATTSTSFNDVISGFLFITTGLSFIITILVCLYVLRTRTTLDISTQNLCEEIIKSKVGNEVATLKLLSIIGKVENGWSDLCSQKAKEFNYIMYSLSISVILLIITITIPYFIKLYSL